MKLNWGSSIAIFYSLFVLVMVGMVIMSTQNKSHLVQENYYQKDLDYEEFRQSRQNATKMKEPVKVKYMANENNLRLTFPSEMSEASGEVKLFRPSNKFMDKTFKLKIDPELKMDIPIAESMLSGLWRVQIEWESQGQKFYNEETIVL